jgi:S-DNA-T family DNA segregation ATPase FtsK/SpoIIIE
MIIGMKRTSKDDDEHLKRTLYWFIARRLDIGVSVLVLAAILAMIYLPAPVWLLAVGLAVNEPTGSRIASFLIRVLSHSRVRRQLVRAARDSGIEGLHVQRVSETLPGEIASARVPRGHTVDDLDKISRAMAGCLRVSDIRVIHDRTDRSHVDISIIRRDVFDGMEATPWPLINAETVNVRKPIPFGLDEYGREVVARLLSRNIIIGGAPDAGKSATLRIIAASAALDPKVRLWMMDAKPGAVEFIHWAPAAYKLVAGRDLNAAVEVFAELEERVERRYQQIVSRGEVFVGPDMEIDVLMIDELPQFTRSFEGDSKEQQAAVKTIRGGIWKIIALGRAAGMITALSAQKPTADIVPSESRDLIDNKFALHCNTTAMSNTILGAGSGEEAPANAADIPSGQPGVGYYIGDSEVQKMRAFFISHKQALEIASRAASRQIDAELEAMT